MPLNFSLTLCKSPFALYKTERNETKIPSTKILKCSANYKCLLSTEFCHYIDNRNRKLHTFTKIEYWSNFIKTLQYFKITLKILITF